MKIFNPAHFLRHISMPTLREFTDAHPLGQSLAIDWSLAQELLPTVVNDAVALLEATMQGAEMTQAERESVEYKLHLWHDDLRRAHLMSNDLSIQEFQTSCAGDREVQEAFASRDAREQSLWMLTFRDDLFRQVELHIAFQAKSNGKYWKKHRIQPGLDPMQDRIKLDAFCHEVAKLYKSVGGGDGTHIEVSKRAADGSVQLTIYIEGPVTAIAHFSENSFKRINTRIALDNLHESPFNPRQRFSGLEELATTIKAEGILQPLLQATFPKMAFDATQSDLVQALRPPARPQRTGGNARSLPKHLQKPAPLAAERGTIVIAGCEAHVCLMQTAVGLLAAGLQVHVVPEACGSRRPADKALALQRLAAAGAQLLSAEMVAFEWLRSCEHPAFKEMLALVK